MKITNLMESTSMSIWKERFEQLSAHPCEKMDFCMVECMQVFFGMNDDYSVYQELNYLM